MAISKAFTFQEEEQSAAAFGLAFAHPARVVIMKRLLSQQVLSFSELVEGQPLTKSTVNQHLEILKRLGMVKSSLMANNLAGYSISYEVYRRGANATREQFRTAATVPLRRFRVGEEEVG